MQKMEKINDEVHLAKEKSRADAEFYKVQKSAEANKLLLTKEYLDLKRIDAMAVNNKVIIFFYKLYPNINLFSHWSSFMSPCTFICKIVLWLRRVIYCASYKINIWCTMSYLRLWPMKKCSWSLQKKCWMWHSRIVKILWNVQRDNCNTSTSFFISSMSINMYNQIRII